MDEATVAIEDAPRCPTCGYVLLGLPDFRCPECGTRFDPEFVGDASFRAHLLPWERPETGGAIRRLARTVVLASLHPGRFFDSVNHRKDRRIANPGTMIAACVLVATCLHAVAYLVERAAFFIRLLIMQGQPQQGLDTMVRASSITWSTELQLVFMQMLPALLWVAVIAALVSRLFRGSLGAFRSLDMAAVYTPAIAFGALIAPVASVVQAVSVGMLSVVMFGAALAQMIVPLLLLWFCCRRLFSLNRWSTARMLIIGGVLLWGCGAAVMWLLVRATYSLGAL